MKEGESRFKTFNQCNDDQHFSPSTGRCHYYAGSYPYGTFECRKHCQTGYELSDDGECCVDPEHDVAGHLPTLTGDCDMSNYEGGDDETLEYIILFVIIGIICYGGYKYFK